MVDFLRWAWWLALLLWFDAWRLEAGRRAPGCRSKLVLRVAQCGAAERWGNTGATGQKFRGEPDPGTVLICGFRHCSGTNCCVDEGSVKFEPVTVCSEEP